jgi:hypothetical protein
MAESSKTGAARFEANKGHRYAIENKTGLYSTTDKPWLELGPAWERVYIIPEDMRGLKRVHSTLEAGPGKRKRECDVLNVWCKEEVKILTRGDESEEAMINGR